MSLGPIGGTEPAKKPSGGPARLFMPMIPSRWSFETTQSSLSGSGAWTAAPTSGAKDTALSQTRPVIPDNLQAVMDEHSEWVKSAETLHKMTRSELTGKVTKTIQQRPPLKAIGAAEIKKFDWWRKCHPSDCSQSVHRSR